MHVLTDKDKELIIKLYNEGKMDSEISKIIGCSISNIQLFRKRNCLPTMFTYDKISKIDNEKFLVLFQQGLTDQQIAEQLKMSTAGIYAHRIRHGYIRETYTHNKPIELTQFQKEVLLGTMMGDSSFRPCGYAPAISCAHGIKQKEYCLYKTEIFQSLGAVCRYHKRNKADKRTGIYYEDYTMCVPSNPALISWYEKFYIDKKKVIPFELLNNFTAVSLAFLFMDDGSKHKKTYQIATNCFSKEELLDFKKFLFIKFNIETTIQRQNILYIRTKSAPIFTNLILPYVHESMKYKIVS